MEGINPLLELPPPIDSLHYFYGDVEQYLDATTSESQSPAESPYDMPYGTDLSNIPSMYSSSEKEEESSQTQKPAAKRKRENRYKNAPPSVLSRRRAQNRASQRAYRERKDQRIKDLEAMLQEAKQNNDVLSKAYASLHAEYLELKMSQVEDSPHLQHHQQQQPQQQQHQQHQHHHQHHPHAYAAAGPPPALDPALGMSPDTDRLEMDLFAYSHVGTSYSL